MRHTNGTKFGVPKFGVVSPVTTPRKVTPWVTHPKVQFQLLDQSFEKAKRDMFRPEKARTTFGTEIKYV
jgi:hypothetical protein